jgi:hypothetical protein
VVSQSIISEGERGLVYSAKKCTGKQATVLAVYLENELQPHFAESIAYFLIVVANLIYIALKL